jgi:hypothetical protein
MYHYHNRQYNVDKITKQKEREKAKEQKRKINRDKKEKTRNNGIIAKDDDEQQ